MSSLADDPAMNLPDGWEVKRLGEVCDISTGKSNSNQAVAKGEYAFFDRFKKIKRSNRYLFDSEALIIPGEGASFLPKHYTGKFDLHQRAYAIFNFNESTNINFVEYYLTFDCKYFERVAVGATVKSLRLRHFQELQIPIPPLPEQKRIVAILDQAFTAINKVKANTEQNLKNARELFESYLQGVFENKGDDWEEKTLGEVANIKYGFTEKSTEEGDYRYIRITDIDKNGELIKSNRKYIKSSDEVLEFILQENDLLMARTGATFAKVLLYTNDEPSVFASYLIKISFTADIENKIYWYFTKSGHYWEQANQLSLGSAQPHFNGVALKKIAFSYPTSIKKQKIIITQLDRLNKQVKSLKLDYQQKLTNLEELKKTILKKAFRGEL